MIQIPYALGIVVVLLFQNRQIILIGMAYQMGRTQFLCPRETLQRVRQVLEPHTRTPGYLAQGLKGLVRFDQGRQEILRLLRPHPFHQHEHTMPADRIERRAINLDNRRTVNKPEAIDCHHALAKLHSEHDWALCRSGNVCQSGERTRSS